MELSESQRRAVERSGQDVCVVAGPGSGKTRTLVARYAWLVENGTDPARILAVTFTDRAALEIKERLMKQFGERADVRAKVEMAPVSTLHGLCGRLLREHAVEAGLDPEFRILDERQARAEQREALDETLDRTAVERRDEFRRLLEAWKTDKPAEELASVYEALRLGRWDGKIDLPPPEPPEALLRRVLEVARAGAASVGRGENDAVRKRADVLRTWVAQAERGGDPLEWLAGKLPNKQAKHEALNQAIEELRGVVPAARRAVVAARFEPCRETVRRMLLDFHSVYSQRKTKSSVLDFEDLEEKTIALLEKDWRLRAELQDSYDAILMDELQDTNPVQWQLMTLLRRPDRFFAVGDVNQSIYGFRHADSGLMQEYERGLTAAGKGIDRLVENYRSRAEILEIVSRVSAAARGIENHVLKAKGEFADAGGPAVELLIAEAGATEARCVARRIREIASAGRRYSDIAVLTRKKTVFEEIERALTEFQVPYLVDRGKNFFAEPEIVDLTNWLRVLDEAGDEIAGVGLLRSPFYAVSDEQLYRLRMDGRVAPVEVEKEWFRLRRLRADRPMDLVVAELIDQSGYLGTLDEKARANVDKFFSLLRGWAAESPGDLRAWIRTIDDLRLLGQEPAAPAVEAGDAVRVMSIHGAKGLEFPVVFVSFLHTRAEGQTAALAWREGAGLGFVWRDPVNGGSSPDGVHQRIVLSEQVREAAEADRLLYVAMTRAQEHLVLSWKDNGSRVSGWPAQILGALGTSGRRVAEEPEVLEVPSPVETREVLEVAPVEAEPGPASGYTVTQVLYGSSIDWPDGEEEARLGIEVHEVLAGVSAADASEEAMELARHFQQGALGRRAANARRVEREYDFVFSLSGVVYRGQVDLWFEDTQGVVLVDYKTDRRVSPGQLERYTKQVQLYALGLPKKVTEAYLALLSENRIVEVDVSDKALNAARDLLTAWRG